MMRVTIMTEEVVAEKIVPEKTMIATEMTVMTVAEKLVAMSEAGVTTTVVLTEARVEMHLRIRVHTIQIKIHELILPSMFFNQFQ